MIGVADPFADATGLVMDAELDTLALAPYVKIDELLIASPDRLPWGLRLHLIATLHSLPIAFALAGANADERHGGHTSTGVLIRILQACSP